MNKKCVSISLLLPVLLLLLVSGCSETSTSKLDTAQTPPPNNDDNSSSCTSNTTGNTVPAPPTLLPAGSYITAGSPLQNFVAQQAAVATVAADYSSGAHSLISGDNQGNFSALNNYQPVANGDLSMAVYGDSFYRIEKMLSGNNIARFAFSDPQTPIWQYSTNDAGSAVQSNPYDMVFVNSSKAYVLRYNSTKVWIVNPSAATEADFKLGELDLSAYGGDDGIPDMGAAVIANGKLFILLQRLEGPTYQVVNDAYIAVFDTATDQEIDTGASCDGFRGIPLRVRNPTGIVYQADSDTLFIRGSGSFFPVDYSGGIETVDASTYASKLVLDDSATYGLITGLMPVSANIIYFVGYRAYNDNTLYVMDINSNQLAKTRVAALTQGQISDLALDAQGLLWVGDVAQATVRIIDPATGNEVASVSTSLNPLKIVFAP